MMRYRRSIAALVIALVLLNMTPLAGAQPVTAADPLGLLPGWADLLDGQLNPAAPPDPLAGLLPRNPLEGLLAQTPTAGSAGGAGATGSAAPETQAPGAPAVPTPPQAPGASVNISPGTGELSAAASDLELPGPGPSFGLTRNYATSAAANEGPFGYGWRLSLDSRLQMYPFYDISEQRGDGGTTSFVFVDGTNGAYVNSSDGDPLIHRDLNKGTYSPDGASGWSLVRESQYRYVVTRPDGTRSIYNGYHAPWRAGEDPKAGRLMRIEGRNGYSLDFTYDGQGRLTRVASADGRSLDFAWSDSHITTVTDHVGRTVTYTYAGGDLTGVSAPDQSTLSYGYDASHRLTALSGGPVGTVAYAYDGEGRVTKAGEATYAYSAAETVLTDAAGGIWRYGLDEQKRTVHLTDPEGGETVTVYDSDGRIMSVTSLGETHTFTYDAQGRVLTDTRNGQTLSYEYGIFGQVTRVDSPTGVTVYRYDADGHLVGRTDPGRPETAYAYDNRGRLISETDAEGNTTRYEYDGLRKAWSWGRLPLSA
jgi:YD repeat-containing protein